MQKNKVAWSPLRYGTNSHKQKGRVRCLPRDLVTKLMLSLLILTLFEFQCGLQNARGSEPVYIEPDGSVYPSSAPISTTDKVTYTLTGNIYDEIVVQKSNIIIEGNGQTVQGTGGGYGLTLNSVNGVTIRNINVRNFISDIWLSNSSNTHIVNNNVTESIEAIALYSSSGNTIELNNIKNTDYGMFLVSSTDNSIRENNISKTSISGIHLSTYSNENTITGNAFTDSGLLVQLSYQNSVEDNTVNGKPLAFLEGLSQRTVTEAGQAVLINCNHIQIENLDLSHTAAGIELYDTTNSIITRNNMANNHYGIWFCNSSSNSVAGNSITDNDIGIQLWWSSNNNLFHNRMANNTDQIYDIAWQDPEVDSSVNVWHDGYPSGGNYWSDYTGTDSHSGLNQNEPGSDGIGDVPYVIDAGNMDKYPLMIILGDINGDHTVDIYDAIILALAYDSRPGESNWNSKADINEDNVVDRYDATIIANNFEK